MAQWLLYCERVLHAHPASVMAEPVNVATNIAYIACGVWALHRYRTRHHVRILARLAIVVGIGSALFHTFATTWAMAADIVPIVAFMLVAWWAARPQFVARWRAVSVALAAAAGGVVGMSLSACPAIGSSAAPLGSAPGYCLNGGLMYVVAPLALGVAAWIMRAEKGVARWYAMAACAMVTSLLLRAVDPMVCPVTTLGPLTMTTHALWHVGTAITMVATIKAVAGDQRSGSSAASLPS